MLNSKTSEIFKVGRLESHRLVLCLGLLASFSIVVQLTYGASIAVVVFAAISVSAGLLGVLVLGVYRLSSWVLFFYVFGSVLVPLLAKTLLGQTLDSHLDAASYSYAVLAIASVELLVVTLVVRRLKVGPPLLKAVKCERQLAWLSWGSFAAGIGFWLINQHLLGPDATGFGGLVVFRDLLLMSVIGRTALVLERSGDRRTIDWGLAAILLVCTLLGLLADSKTQAAYPWVSYFATLLFYRRSLPFSQVVGLALGAILFVYLFSPMIHAWRNMGQQGMPLGQRVELILGSMKQVTVDNEFNRYEKLASRTFRHGYYNYFGGMGRGQMILGRYAAVQQIDPVMASVNVYGVLGGGIIWSAFGRLVPRVLYPNKPNETEAYRIVRELKLIGPNAGRYPTVPLVGQAYAAFGIVGVLVVPGLIFFLFQMFLKKVGWSLYRNVFAIFILCDFVLVYVNQGDLAQYLGIMLRNLPLLAAAFWILVRMSRVGLGQRDQGTDRA